MEFKNTLAKYKKIVNREIELFFDKKISEVKHPFLKTSYSFLKEYVLRDGKRLRPIAAIIAYKSVCEKEEEKIYKPAIAAELFHASSLIHDDIMDEDSLRRNKPSMHKLFEKHFLKKYKEIIYNGEIFNKSSTRFGVSMAIIQGNVLYSLAESCLAEADFEKELIRQSMVLCNKTYKIINEGQTFDILLSTEKNITEKDYFDMATKKTAKLFATAAEIGSILGKATEAQKKALSNYIFLASTAFQIQDDILDISEKKGHAIGSDIKKGKRTLLIIKALNSATKKQKNTLLKILGKENASEKEIKEVIEILNETGVIEYAKNIALEKIKEAKKFLKKAKPELKEEGLKFFEAFADYMVRREL